MRKRTDSSDQLPLLFEQSVFGDIERHLEPVHNVVRVDFGRPKTVARSSASGQSVPDESSLLRVVLDRASRLKW